MSAQHQKSRPRSAAASRTSVNMPFSVPPPHTASYLPHHTSANMARSGHTSARGGHTSADMARGGHTSADMVFGPQHHYYGRSPHARTSSDLGERHHHHTSGLANYGPRSFVPTSNDMMASPFYNQTACEADYENCRPSAMRRKYANDMNFNYYDSNDNNYNGRGGEPRHTSSLAGFNRIVYGFPKYNPQNDHALGILTDAGKSALLTGSVIGGAALVGNAARYAHCNMFRKHPNQQNVSLQTGESSGIQSGHT